MKYTDVANAGIARPPLIFLLSLLGGYALNHLWPYQASFGMVASIIGALFLILGVVIFILARREFELAATPIPGNKPSTAVINTGIFNLSRNPIYLSFTSIYLAVVFWTQSLWLLVFLVVALVLVSCVVIPREEEYLERNFGDDYVRYKTKVRRWL